MFLLKKKSTFVTDCNAMRRAWNRAMEQTVTQLHAYMSAGILMCIAGAVDHVARSVGLARHGLLR